MAQAIGVEVEVDTAFYGSDTPTPDDTFDPQGLLDGYVSYLVYVRMTNPDDVLSAVFADTLAFPVGGALTIDAECGCWNPFANSMTLEESNNSTSWGLDPMFEYDTFWTIGKLKSDDPGQNPSWLSEPNFFGDAICSAEVVNGSVYTLGTPVNAVAGDDLRVLVARVTTCDDWSLNLNAQVFVGGDQSNEQIFLLGADGNGPFQVTDPCQDYADVEAEVTGAVLPCDASVTDVSIEFLGLEEGVEGTMYQLTTSSDDFVDEIIVLSESPSNVFPGLLPGDYRVHVTNDYGCMDTTDFTIDPVFPIAATFELLSDNNCFNEENASVSLAFDELSGGTGTLTITGFRPDGMPMVAQNLTDSLYWDGLTCAEGNGLHSFSIVDESGCEFNATIPVNCPDEIVASFAQTDVVCAGEANGSITAEASGGTGQLFLTNQFETVPVEQGLNGLGPANYSVQVVDERGCLFPAENPEMLDIAEPPALNLVLGQVTPPTCGLNCDGAVEFEASGGTGSLDIAYLNESTGQLSTEPNGLCAGDYLVTVSDESGCASSLEFEVLGREPLGFLIETTNATCTGMSNGSADIFPFGGNVSDQEYNVAYLDTAGNPVNLNNLSEMVYTAVVTDQVGCSHLETFEIGVDVVTDMELTTLTSPVTCWNAADGTATVSVIGGEEPYSYEWSDPYSQSTSTANGLTEDTYTVVVTDALGCRRTASQTVDAIEGCLFIADALSPNNDGFNDDWVVGGLEDFPSSTLMVFNRWGQKLFETSGGEVRWDGQFNGARLPVADYYYAIELFPGALPIRGTVTLKY